MQTVLHLPYICPDGYLLSELQSSKRYKALLQYSCSCEQRAKGQQPIPPLVTRQWAQTLPNTHQ